MKTRPDHLDLMMPEMNGNDFMRSYRRAFDTPIIILTARLAKMIKCWVELGADDYVTSRSARELTAWCAVPRRLEKVSVEQDILRAAVL
jgi:DNA-binding response OmpR family regulator